MLSDPLPLKRLSLAAHAAITVITTDSFARVDAGDGSARYVCQTAVVGDAAGVSGESTLRISHSVSNEQKPVKTSRALIRLDIPVMGSNGSLLNSYAYAVIGVPQASLVDGDDGTTPITRAAVARDLVEYLVAALAVSSTAATLDETKIDRILAGES